MPRWSASNEDVIKFITMLVQEIQVTVFIIVPVAYAIYRRHFHHVGFPNQSFVSENAVSLYRGQSLPCCDLCCLLRFFVTCALCLDIRSIHDIEERVLRLLTNCLPFTLTNRSVHGLGKW